MNDILIQLENPLVDIAIVLGVASIAIALNLWRNGVRLPPLAHVMRAVRAKAGSAELAQQGLSRVISMVTIAAAVFIVGYGVLLQVRTETCAHNLSEISAAEDLRFSEGYGYTANGNVTAAAFVDSDGNNEYLRTTPGDPAAPKGANYTFVATVTNGDWSYTIDDPTTAVHAAWTTLAGRFQNATSSTTNLQYIGPDGAVQAH